MSINMRSFGKRFYFSLSTFPLSLFVKAHLIPSNNLQNLYHELGIDPDKPIAYILPFNSIFDLMILRRYCLKLGLPDPLNPLLINQKSFSRYVFINQTHKLLSKKDSLLKSSLVTFSSLFKKHKEDPELDLQIVPCSILWGRSPGRERENGKATSYLSSYNLFQKLAVVLFNGRDCVIKLSPKVSLRYMVKTLDSGTPEVNHNIALKLARVANIHFSRQKLATSGPVLPDRAQMLQQLLKSNKIKQAIHDEAIKQNVTIEKIEAEALKIIDEIAANFSAVAIKYAAAIMQWIWSKLYQGIHSSHIDRVRKLAQEGHEIIYLPCHRSNMDYLLLSYELHQQGLAPPHIASGINLNFFPVGILFRLGGAFFIRRSFKGDPLYSTIFKEYLSYLCSKGYPLEFFCEGGRSRTGRLLQPKMGMLSMTLQTFINGLNRPVTLVPIYLGYEHVMEVASYTKELRGKKKEKENARLILKLIRKLQNYGHGYINFGEPIQLNQFLNEVAPQWKDMKAESLGLSKKLEDSNHEELQPTMPHFTKSEWFNSTVNKLALRVMTHINSATATNALTLCALALFSSPQRALGKEELEKQIQCYLDLLKNIPYSNSVTYPDLEANELIEHAIRLNKFIIEHDHLGDIISINREQSLLMTYYRNNIIHLFILPSFIANMIIRHPKNNKVSQIIEAVQLIYPFLKTELFLPYGVADLPECVDQILTEFERQELITINKQSALKLGLHFGTHEPTITLNKSNTRHLQLLAYTVSETLQRYVITMTLLQNNSSLDEPEHSDSNTPIELEVLQEKSLLIAQRLSRLHGINAPEFFDKDVFNLLMKTLREEGYIFDLDSAELSGESHSLTHINSAKIRQLTKLLRPLILSEINLTIDSVVSFNG